ncbi:MAG: hypothetical protein H6607_02710 [Flavobacteriales bacterium]|nr:hypothetical protein [Flavobacteriales bacterium]
MNGLLNLFALENQCDPNKFGKEVHLDKISDDMYRVSEFGIFKPILEGGNLVDNSIAEILCKYVADQISSIKEVKIWRKSTDETWNNYSEIIYKNHLNLKNIKRVKSDGFRIYQLYFDRIYVSSNLKEKLILECEKSDKLEFDNEFPMYVA